MPKSRGGTRRGSSQGLTLPFAAVMRGTRLDPVVREIVAMAEKTDTAGDEREAGTSKPKSKFKLLCSAAFAFRRTEACKGKLKTCV